MLNRGTAAELSREAAKPDRPTWRKGAEADLRAENAEIMSNKESKEEENGSEGGCR